MKKGVSISVRTLAGNDHSFVDLVSMRWSFIFYSDATLVLKRIKISLLGYIVVHKDGTIPQAKNKPNRQIVHDTSLRGHRVAVGTVNDRTEKKIANGKREN